VTECLESVKLQNYPNLELIINDDASRDNSAALIENWLAKNPGIPHRFLRNQTNQGLCRSLNNALAHTSGKYFSGIAADDAWLAGKLRNQVALMERLPDKVGVIYSDALRIDEHGNLVPPTFLEATFRNCHFAEVPQGNIHLALWQANFVAPMTTLIRRECFARVGLFDETKFAEDWDMWLRISRYYEFVYSPEVSAKYRKVQSSICNAQLDRLLDDENHTCLKHLRAGDLEEAARNAAVMRLYNLAIYSYERKTFKHKGNVLQALRFRPTPGLALRCIFALGGIGSSQFARIRRVLQGQESGGEQPVETGAVSNRFRA
jgi:glycosyltransferase involved in cell wall biosynthesis